MRRHQGDALVVPRVSRYDSDGLRHDQVEEINPQVRNALITSSSPRLFN
jgi:hypothetical protein